MVCCDESCFNKYVDFLCLRLAFVYVFVMSRVTLRVCYCLEALLCLGLSLPSRVCLLCLGSLFTSGVFVVSGLCLRLGVCCVWSVCCVWALRVCLRLGSLLLSVVSGPSL
jgi:hypothetical protein